MPDNMLLGFLALLVIFLIIAAVGYLQDEAKTRGTLALVGACGLGLFTAFYVYPRLGLDGNTVEVAKLKAELAQIKKDTVKLAQEREAFKSEASKTAQEKAALESQHGTQMTALLNELGQVRDRVRDPEVGVRISRQTAGAEETAATPPYERAMAQVRDLKTIEARSVPKSADPPADRADTTTS